MKVNLELLKDLERSINTIEPEKGSIPIKVLGFGEISLVFEILDDPEHLAYKRIPIFDTEAQVKRHIWAYNSYCHILKNKVGLNLPAYDAAWFKDDNNTIQFYCIQEKILMESVANKVIHNISKDEILILVTLILREMKKVWEYSQKNPKIDLGLDGQISNFAIINYNPQNPHVDFNSKLYYFDTSTPMLRIHNVEAMEAILFLKSAPSFLRWLLKALFLEETVGRYYEWRKVAIDLIANFYKEQLPKLIPRLIKLVNDFFAEEAPDFNITPITLEEINKYYKSDSNMWEIFQSVRKFDRYLKTKIFKKKYEFYLPDKIER